MVVLVCKFCKGQMIDQQKFCSVCGLNTKLKPLIKHKNRNNIQFVQNLFDPATYDSKKLDPLISEAYSNTPDGCFWQMIYFDPAYTKSEWYKKLLSTFGWKAAK